MTERAFWRRFAGEEVACEARGQVLVEMSGEEIRREGRWELEGKRVDADMLEHQCEK